MADRDQSLVITERSNLAAILLGLGRAKESEPLDRRNLDVQEKRGVEDLDLATHLNAYAVDLVNLGRSTEAEPSLRRSLQCDCR